MMWICVGGPGVVGCQISQTGQVTQRTTLKNRIDAAETAQTAADSTDQERSTSKRNPRMGLFSSSVFRRKDITHLIGEMDDGERLNRRLGPFALMGLGIGATVGTGLYVQTGFVANEVAGPSIILSFLLAAVGCGFAAFCYSELASMVPVAGSAYTYAYATMGELVAWIIGWDLILEYAIASGAVAAGWSNYFERVPAKCLPLPVRSSTELGALGLRRRQGRVPPQDGRARRRADGHGLVQLAGRAHHGGRHRRAGDRRQGKRGLERGDGAAQHRRDSDGRRHRRGLHRPEQLAAVLARKQGLERGRRRGRAGFSSHTSASTRSRPTPKRPGVPSATWRSA